MKGDKGKVTDTTKVTTYCQNYKCVCEVCDGCM